MRSWKSIPDVITRIPEIARKIGAIFVCAVRANSAWASRLISAASPELSEIELIKVVELAQTNTMTAFPVVKDPDVLLQSAEALLDEL